MPPSSPSPSAITMTQSLIAKYNIHFNFFLTKPLNQLIYNHTHAPTTIDFKDTAILADHNQYLKRYYFMVNSQQKQEIYDRINLLADFYVNAVLLRYQHPLMILTGTKSIFLKRIKRKKKILVEEGSSDQSKSQNQEKIVSINSSKFLKSLSSSQLEAKSFQLPSGQHLQLDFSLFKEEMEEYDVYQGIEEQKEAGAEGIGGVGGVGGIKGMGSIIGLFQKEMTSELILEKEEKEDDVGHFVIDFEDVDQDAIMKMYQKIVEKQNRKKAINKRQFLSNRSSLNPKKQAIIMPLSSSQLPKKQMTSSITITPLQDNPHHLSYKQPGKVTPRLSQLPVQAPKDHQNNIKRSSFYQYEIEHNKYYREREEKMREFVIDQEEDSPRNGGERADRGDRGDRGERMPGRSSFHSGDHHFKGFTSRQRPGAVANLNNKDKQAIRRSKMWSTRSPNMKYSTLPSQQPLQRPSYSQQQHFPPPPNRMTSINININNHQQPKDDHRVNLIKYHRQPEEQQYREDDRMFRAEKKKKIREKAAALLNRVKSQEYMRPAGGGQGAEGYEQNGGAYYQKYYH